MLPVVRSACPTSVPVVKIPGARPAGREHHSGEIAAYRMKTMHQDHETTVKKRGSGPGTRTDGLGDQISETDCAIKWGITGFVG